MKARFNKLKEKLKRELTIDLKENIKWFVLFICLVIFIFLIQNAFNKEIMTMDRLGYNYISKYIISDNITPIAKFITNFGGVIFLIIATLSLFLIIKNKKIGLCICINLIFSAGLNTLLKHIVQRPRPTEFRIIDEGGYSFPSGHSMVSMAFYGFLIYLVYKNIENKYLKRFLIGFLSILIFLIGTSRIYLGVHYTSDVLAGFVLAISYLIIFTKLAEKTIK